jgi:hypothetical protein
MKPMGTSIKLLATSLCLLALTAQARKAIPYPAASPISATGASLVSQAFTEWSIESFDGSGFWLQWKNPTPGKGTNIPERTVAFALPSGAQAEATLSMLDGHASALTGVMKISPASRYRDVEIAALTWAPQIQPGNTELPNSARIRITFKSSSKPVYRSAFAPSINDPSERALGAWIVNYAQSRNFRSTPISGLTKTSSDGPSASALLPKERLIVKTSGENIEVLDYTTLLNNRVPLSKIDPRRMHLYHNGAEIPIFIQGEDDGKWNAGDYIEFIGRRAQGQNSFNSFYTGLATFILTWEETRMGMRAPRVPVAVGTGGTLSLPERLLHEAKPFMVHDHKEMDIEVLRIGSTSVEEIIDLGSRVLETELTDFWFWKRLGTDKDATEIPFNLDYVPLPQTTGSVGSDSAGFNPSGTSLRVTVNIKGITNNPKADPDHHLKFILNGSDISLIGGINHDAIWEGQESYTWVSPPVNPNILKPGANKLVIQKVNDLKTTDGQLVENQDAFLNFLTFDFPATYKVQQDKLDFSNSFPDSLGSKIFSLSGFTTEDISLWDKQGRKLSNFQIKRLGKTFDLSFSDSLVSPTAYIASSLKNREIPQIAMDTLDNLISPTLGADYIIITEKYLLGPALDSLIAFRSKQGLRCAVVMASHIYQAFGDGSLDPSAIRRFVAYAYKNWPRPAPLYLNLVGDVTFWFEKRNDGSQVTTVPTHLINIRGWGVAANDDFFTKVSGDDDIADLFVGRMPVSSRGELSRIVRKTILLETVRPQGHWRNKALLISGYESSFMAQNYLLQAIALENDRQISRLDLFPGSPHYKNASQRGDFFDQMDSSFNLVNFIGHGGGAVWSDAGVLTLKALDEGKLKAEFPIPLISSITCLTGYFEDVSERSLGEELIRMAKGGAAGFYGSAGYISNLAGEALSAEILRATTGNTAGTNGALITRAETMVKLRTGDAYLPILAEFNLLGDPALQFSFPNSEGILNLKPKALAGGAAIQGEGSSLALEAGDGVATVLLADSIESNTEIKVARKAFNLDRTIGSPIGSVQNGKVVVNYWNEKESRVVSAPFATLDWLIDSVAIAPPNAAPGDSISIRLKLNTSYAKITIGGGIASYVIGGTVAPQFPGENQVGLISTDGMHLESIRKVILNVPALGQTRPQLYLAFNLNVAILDDKDLVIQNINNLTSRAYSLPLSDLASLELADPAIRLPIQEKLGLWVVFHNKGLGTTKGFRISMIRDAEGLAPISDTTAYNADFPFGSIDSLFFPMADSMLAGKRIRASLIPSREGELAIGRNSQDTVFHLSTKILASQLDTLHLDTTGAFLLLGSNTPNHRIFSRLVSVSALPSHLSPASGLLPIQAILIESEAPTLGSFILGKPFPLTPLAKTSAIDRPYWHYAVGKNQPWLKLDTLPTSDAIATAKGSWNGMYVLLINQDQVAPVIQVSSHGQVLLPDDFVPLNTPIDIAFRDGQGIDRLMHPPSITSREQTLDSLNQSQSSSELFPALARVSFLPKHRADRDSLIIVAEDISGNIATRSLMYRLGEKLSIRDLGSYPNPFADTAVFVYSLTDYCDKVELQVFSRTGRLVRKLNQRNVVGYQEVVWDGLTGDKKEIANGLYFLKVTATAGQKESNRIFKLFKKQRK